MTTLISAALIRSPAPGAWAAAAVDLNAAAEDLGPTQDDLAECRNRP